MNKLKQILRTKCICGKWGRGLSTCKHCGEFIPMTLCLDITVACTKKRKAKP